MQPLPELAELRDAVYIGGKKVLSDDYLKQLTPLSLAIWYMDDGCFTLRSKGLQQRTRRWKRPDRDLSSRRCRPDTRERLRDYLADTWGINANAWLRGAGGKAVLQFPTGETAKFQALIAPFVHPSMEYKLLPRFRGRFAVEPVFAGPRQVLMPMPITHDRAYKPTDAEHAPVRPRGRRAATTTSPTA